MDTAGLCYCLLGALFYTFHPIISRYSKLPPAWISIMLATGTLPTTVLWGVTTGGMTSLPPIRSLLIGLGAGIINGMGIIVYGVLVGGKMDISRITPVIFGATFALTAVFSWLLLGELFTDKKVIGFILMAIAVFLLK